MGYDESRRYTAKKGTDCLSTNYIRLQQSWGGVEYFNKKDIRSIGNGQFEVKYDRIATVPNDGNERTDIFDYGDYQDVNKDFLAFLKAIGSKYETDSLTEFVSDELKDDVNPKDYTAYQSDAGITLYVYKEKCDWMAGFNLSTQKAIDIFSKVTSPDDRIVWENVAEVNLGWDA